MTPINLAHNTLDKLRGIKIPVLNRAKLVKFFNEAFLDIHEDEFPQAQKPLIKKE